MNKKIAFLSHLDRNLYTFRGPIIKQLVQNGHEVYAVCPPGDKNDALKSLGCEVVNYKISRQSLNPLQELLTIQSIYRAIKPLKLNVLQSFTAKPNIYGSIAGKKAGIPLVCNAVTGLGSFYVENTLKAKAVRTVMNILYKFANTKADYCIFQNSDDMRYFKDKKLVACDKAVLIKSSGIDTKQFKPRASTSIPQKRIRVLMIARAIWHKGIKEYYEAAGVLQGVDVAFVLIGGTDEGNPSCADKKFLENGSVKWLGRREDIKEQIDKCDIFVLPSFYGEGVPRTLLEAASMGKPIVTTSNVGCKEVVDDGVNGFLVPVKDSKTLAEKIRILIKDRSMRERMGQASRQKAINEFEIHFIVQQYLKLYQGRGQEK
ncbi:MAG: glycosyltransferase family 4 protein [Campylobacterota bacterium]